MQNIYIPSSHASLLTLLPLPLLCTVLVLLIDHPPCVLPPSPRQTGSLLRGWRLEGLPLSPAKVFLSALMPLPQSQCNIAERREWVADSNEEGRTGLHELAGEGCADGGSCRFLRLMALVDRSSWMMPISQASSLRPFSSIQSTKRRMPTHANWFSVRPTRTT